MGLLDRWTKKKEEEQLKKKPEIKTGDVVVPTKKTVKKDKSTVKSTVKGKVDNKKQTGKKVDNKKLHSSNAYKVLVRPLVTEKSAVMGSLNKYSFLVHRDANKDEIRKAIKAVYGMRPVAVNVANVQGRRVRFGRARGRRSDYKKAIVTLAKGDSIVVHEGV